MKEKNKLTYSKYNESEIKKEEAIKVIAQLIKKYDGQLLKKNEDNIPSSC
ncbi:hypothetical protein V5F90_22370 [Priestia aryabhattai]